MAQIFDSHLHLYQMPHSTVVTAAVVPALNRQQWQPMLRRFANAGGVRLALGVHPCWADEWNADSADLLRTLLTQPQVVAVGETGLDGLTCAVADDVQLAAFTAQVKIAAEFEKPLILHCCKRYGVLLNTLKCNAAHGVGGVVHGFSGSSELAMQLVRCGLMVGIGRMVLNKQAKKLRSAVVALPDNMLLIESDMPWADGSSDAAGVLHRVAAEVACLRSQSVAEIIVLSENNARRLFNIVDTQSP